MIINSSYVDFGHSERKNPESSIFGNLRTDYYTIADLEESRNLFFGSFGLDGARNNPYMSPASESPDIEHVSFVGFPRTLNFVGGAEILRDQNRVLNERMVRDMGEDNVTYVEMPDAVHDFVSFDWHEPERSQALQIIEAWLQLE
ncbi:hypothetical protein NM688_g3201 [Phlebia brevispora]|uniref:Uncharacterized protein n=1 Tax=Phlebia brevispora TaxID=194682 RepID=A0ACC1T6H9_9APHY|nr:hypothetical protein NM688_g3201 [Phlebia brevispora]